MMRIFALVEKKTFTVGVVRDLHVCATTTPSRPELSCTMLPIG
jgi:hypothetical protein